MDETSHTVRSAKYRYISLSNRYISLSNVRISQERLTWLCSVTGSPFPIMNKEEKIDKIEKKVEKILIEPLTVNHILEIREKVPIPAGSAKLLKIQVEENWRLEKL